MKPLHPVRLPAPLRTAHGTVGRRAMDRQDGDPPGATPLVVDLLVVDLLVVDLLVAVLLGVGPRVVEAEVVAGYGVRCCRPSTARRCATCGCCAGRPSPSWGW